MIIYVQCEKKNKKTKKKDTEINANVRQHHQLLQVEKNGNSLVQNFISQEITRMIQKRSVEKPEIAKLSELCAVCKKRQRKKGL